MRTVCSLIVCVLVLASPPAGGTVIEIPVSGLQGRYFDEETFTRSTTFELEQQPADVHRAALRLRGTATVRMTECGFWPFEPYPEPVNFWSSIPDSTTGGSWLGGISSPAESGPFELTIEFEPWRDAGWDFLNDRRGEIALWGIGCSPLDLCWPVTMCSEAFVDDATLIIDAEFRVPIKESTWGKIKALYRNKD